MVPHHHVRLSGADLQRGAWDDGRQVPAVVQRDHRVLVAMPELHGNPDVLERETPRPRQHSDVLYISPHTRPDRLAQGLDSTSADRRHLEPAPVGRRLVSIGLLDKETWVAADQPAENGRPGVEQPRCWGPEPN